MILYLSLAAIGYLAGSRLRNVRERLKWIGKVQTCAIFCLVVSMGTRMGANDEIVNNLRTIGITAFTFTVVILILNIIAVHFAAKILRMNKIGKIIQKGAADMAEKCVTVGLRDGADRAFDNDAAIPAADEPAAYNASADDSEKKSGPALNRMTLIIIIAVCIGIVLGFFVIRPAFEGRFSEFDTIASNIIRLGLCVLLLLTGVDMGLDGTVFNSIKSVGFRILIVPAFAMAASFAGGLISGLFFNLSVKESLAIAGGLGWYSLAPGLIMDAGFIRASAISFFHNVTREICAIIIIPMVAERIGYLETVGLPGAAAMDVCLPVVEKATCSDMTVYSFISGVILSFAVPILLPVILSF